jgi:hypothetical protein
MLYKHRNFLSLCTIRLTGDNPSYNVITLFSCLSPSVPIVLSAEVAPLPTGERPPTQGEGSDKTYDKPSNMGLPGYTSGISLGNKCSKTAEEIAEEPQPKKKHGWKFNNLAEKDHRHQSSHYRRLQHR